MGRLKKWLREWLEIPDGVGSGFTDDDRKKLEEAHRFHQAVEDAAAGREPREYRLAEIYATKRNPITEYRINLD